MKSSFRWRAPKIVGEVPEWPRREPSAEARRPIPIAPPLRVPPPGIALRLGPQGDLPALDDSLRKDRSETVRESESSWNRTHFLHPVHSLFFSILEVSQMGIVRVASNSSHPTVRLVEALCLRKGMEPDSTPQTAFITRSYRLDHEHRHDADEPRRLRQALQIPRGVFQVVHVQYRSAVWLEYRHAWPREHGHQALYFAAEFNSNDLMISRERCSYLVSPVPVTMLRVQTASPEQCRGSVPLRSPDSLDFLESCRREISDHGCRD